MTRTTKGLLVGTAFVALVGWIWISVHFANRREEMTKNHAQHVGDLKTNWMKDRQNKMAEYHTELEMAWAGGIKAAIKDPDLQIADMLCKAAVAACPPSANAEVRIDNFNEFDIFIHVKSPLEKEPAAAAVKALLMECGKYVNSISFVYDNEVVKTIDKRGVDSITDWASVDPTTVGNTMYTP